MVGYRSERYRRFGWASARADDLANLLPARLTYLLIALAALLTRHDARGALRIGWRDGRKHPSPNSAWAEAAMAGALRVRLGGPATYQGVPSAKPHLGDPGATLTPETVEQAIRLMLVTAWLALLFLAGSVLLVICMTRTRHPSLPSPSAPAVPLASSFRGRPLRDRPWHGAAAAEHPLPFRRTRGDNGSTNGNPR
jgi:cobalamin biosynthesis protein CobD/CbiB